MREEGKGGEGREGACEKRRKWPVSKSKEEEGRE